MGKIYESATSIGGAEFCERKAWIEKSIPYTSGSKSPVLYQGQLEHEFFELEMNLHKQDATNEKNLLSPALHADRKLRINDHIRNMVFANHPEMSVTARDTLESLNYRSDLHFNSVCDNGEKLLSQGMPYEDVRHHLFPIYTEYQFHDTTYNVNGYADWIFESIDGTYEIWDIKSHHSRIDALIHRDEHAVQMGVYSILAQQEFNIPVHTCRIFYSQDLSIETFHITEKQKSKIIDLRNNMYSLLESPVPSMLEGNEAFKCKYCYKRDACFELEQTLITPHESYTSLDQSHNSKEQKYD